MKNKELYDKIPSGKIIHCRICGNNYKKTNFGVRELMDNGEIGNCKYCTWLKKHNIPIINGWSENEIKNIIYFILMHENVILNDLLLTYVNKSLKNICELVQQLKIANKKINVKINCTCCNKEVLIAPSVYLKTKQPYCSHECYWKDKTNQVSHGENSPYYNRISTECTNCGKPIKIIPKRYNNRNLFGDTHNFCSKECYWNYRSKYYRDEKNSLKGTHLSQDRIEQLRLNMIKQLNSDDRLNTSIQLIVNSMLEDLDMLYEREFPVKYYSIDNYIVNHNLMIEVMGDYWHGNPLLYNDINRKLNKIQSDGIHRDKVKHSYIKNQYHIEILYLWESDINKNFNMCKNLIQEYIKSNGILDNYHSFNYTLEENNLKLNDNIVVPYQNIPINEYRHLIK